MSSCPHCQSELQQPDFCRTCFRALQPAPGGRFAALLEQGFGGVVTDEPASPGTDLTSVTYQVRGWRPNFSGLKVLAGLGLSLLVLVGLSGAYRHNQYLEAVRHRQNGQALTRQGDYEGARRQLGLAPEEPETHQARAELAICEGRWEEAASEFRLISVNDAEVNRHLDESALAQAQELLKKARQSKDSAQALGFSDQAEQLLDQHNGSSSQLAQLHFVRAQLFQRLDLPAEALQELAETLHRDPRHQGALQLRSQLAPPPVVAARTTRAKPARPIEPQVDIPRLQMDPGYPTYQAPDPESTPDEDDEADRGSSGKARRRRNSRSER